MFRPIVMKFVVPSTLLALLVGPAAVEAATREQSDALPTRVVKYADLDLTRSEGAAVLYSRINAAARQVCEMPILLPNVHSQADKCRLQAISKAVADVSSATLTKYYQAKTTLRARDGQPR